jgi:hypothetical protein
VRTGATRDRRRRSPRRAVHTTTPAQARLAGVLTRVRLPGGGSTASRNSRRTVPTGPIRLPAGLNRHHQVGRVLQVTVSDRLPDRLLLPSPDRVIPGAVPVEIAGAGHPPPPVAGGRAPSGEPDGHEATTTRRTAARRRDVAAPASAAADPSGLISRSSRLVLECRARARPSPDGRWVAVDGAEAEVAGLVPPKSFHARHQRRSRLRVNGFRRPAFHGRWIARRTRCSPAILPNRSPSARQIACSKTKIALSRPRRCCLAAPTATQASFLPRNSRRR